MPENTSTEEYVATDYTKKKIRKTLLIAGASIVALGAAVVIVTKLNNTDESDTEE
jgi:hypothetical protein